MPTPAASPTAPGGPTGPPLGVPGLGPNMGLPGQPPGLNGMPSGPPGQMPPGHMPPGHMAPGQLPPGQMPPGQMPPGHMPPGHMPPGHMPPGHMPPGHMPPGHMPPGHMPPGHMPPGHMPPGHMPPGQMQRGHMPPGVELCKVVQQSGISLFGELLCSWMLLWRHGSTIWTKSWRTHDGRHTATTNAWLWLWRFATSTWTGATLYAEAADARRMIGLWSDPISGFGTGTTCHNMSEPCILIIEAWLHLQVLWTLKHWRRWGPTTGEALLCLENSENIKSENWIPVVVDREVPAGRFGVRANQKCRDWSPSPRTGRISWPRQGRQPCNDIYLCSLIGSWILEPMEEVFFSYHVKVWEYMWVGKLRIETSNAFSLDPTTCQMIVQRVHWTKKWKNERIRSLAAEDANDC